MMRVSIGLPVAASGMQHTSNMIPRSMLIGFLSARHRSAGQPWHILGRCGGRSASTHRLILLWLKLVMSTLVLSTGDKTTVWIVENFTGLWVFACI